MDGAVLALGSFGLMSSAFAHPTLHVYDPYFEAPRGSFVHTTAQLPGESVLAAT